MLGKSAAKDTCDTVLNVMKHLSSDIEMIHRASAERARRVPRHRKVAIHHYRPTNVLPDQQLALAGTITVFFAHPGSGLLKEIEMAVSKNDGSDRRVARKVLDLFADRKRFSLEEAVSKTTRAPIIAELRYGGKTLVENITLPGDLEVGVIVLPFNGGNLLEDGLQWIEFHHPHVEAGLDVYAVYNQPNLTPAEIAALKLIPEEMAEINVGYGPGDVACSVLLLTVAVVVEVAIVAATYAITGSDRRYSTEISPDAIAALGPVGTANALLQMRTSILLGRTLIHY